MLKGLKDFLSRSQTASKSGPEAAASLQKAFRRFDAGDFSGAQDLCREVLRIEPGNARALYLAGAVAHEFGNPGVAADWLRQAVAADSAVAIFHYRQGCALQDLGDSEGAVASYRRALELDPRLAKAHNNLGCLLEAGGEAEAAAAAYREALAHDPGLAPAYYNLGNLLKQQERFDEAIEWFCKALALEPDRAEWRRNLGNALHRKGRVAEAVACYREAIRLNPEAPTTYMDLGNALTDRGRHLEAEEAYRNALSLKPDYPEAHSNILLTLHYRTGGDPDRLFPEHLLWASKHALPLYRTASGHSNSRDPARRLRVGYLSPDFRRHSVAFFVEPVLASHDRARFEVFAYSDVARPDDVTARLESAADHWHDIATLDHDAVAELIRRDGIDILVDLAGHTGKNRMLLFARKPAPVQVSYLGYPNTTGLATMDYRLTDGDADPVGITDSYYTECLVRLPRGFLCYRPAPDSPPAGDLPCLAHGRIRFGSFNNFVKMTDEAIGLWSRILREVPGSELMLKGNGLTDPENRHDLVQRFADCGIAPERLVFQGPVPELAEHLACYHEMDIALDVFPYNGTTTTCEALWMGVPVVSLAGRTHVTRVGASILKRVGLAELIAATPEDYIAIASRLAGEPERLRALRSGLRQQLKDSSLCDETGFTRELESAYGKMWEHWCEAPAVPPAPETEVLRLHIGGVHPKAGWKILNIKAGPGVDFIGGCSDLRRFAGGSVEEIYCSHVLEHLGYLSELPAALTEFFRVLRPGGNAKISVPDFELLCRLYLRPEAGSTERFAIMRIAFGGQLDQYDFHRVGLSHDFLMYLFRQAGFSRVERAEQFGIFDDMSGLRVDGQLISLNVIAYK